jgi:hypothetical protein
LSIWYTIDVNAAAPTASTTPISFSRESSKIASDRFWFCSWIQSVRLVGSIGGEGGSRDPSEINLPLVLR